MNVADALQAYERAKKDRKQELCGQLDGGPDTYNYLPERCVKKRSHVRQNARSRQSARSRRNSEMSESRSSISNQSLQGLKQLVERLQKKKTEKETEAEVRRREASSSRVPKQVKAATAPLLELLTEMPEFMAFACKKIVDVDMVTSFPNHEERWKEVNRIWPGKCEFGSNLGVKLSVMAFALAFLT